MSDQSEQTEPTDEDRERAELAAQVRAEPRDTLTATEVAANEHDRIDRTWNMIAEALETLRAERERLDAQIAEWVAFADDYHPVYRRIVEGHRPRRKKPTDTEE